MERKIKVLLGALCCFAMLGASAHAQTSTVGGGLKSNGVNNVSVIPSQPGVLKCFGVHVATNAPTLVLSADTLRSSLFLVNASTSVTPSNRGPIIYLSSSATSNLGVNFAQNLLPTMLALPMPSCVGGGLVGSMNGGCNMNLSGVSVFSGAIYAIAESSGVHDSSAYLQGCYLNP